MSGPLDDDEAVKAEIRREIGCEQDDALAPAADPAFDEDLGDDPRSRRPGAIRGGAEPGTEASP